MKTQEIVMSSDYGEDEEEQEEDLSIELSEKVPENEYEIKLLQDSMSQNSFLTRLGILQLFYWTYVFFIIELILHYQHDYRRYYWLYKLNVMSWIFILLLLLVKVAFSFTGHVIRNLSIVFFALDIVLTYFVTVGVFFLLNVYVRTMYIYDVHYMIITVANLALTEVGFILSTLYLDKRRKYNWILGMIFMEICTVIVVYYCQIYYDNITMGNTRYEIVIIALTLLNFYESYNAFILINYRGMKFYENEYIYAFFCNFTDWLGPLWVNMMNKNKDIRERRAISEFGSHLEEVVEANEFETVKNYNYENENYIYFCFVFFNSKQTSEKSMRRKEKRKGVETETEIFKKDNVDLIKRRYNEE